MSQTQVPATSAMFMTESGVPPTWKHMRSVGQSVSGRAPGGLGPSGVVLQTIKYNGH